jgi:hypothetical protein
MEGKVGRKGPNNSAQASLVGRGSGITHPFEQSRLLCRAPAALGLTIAEPLCVPRNARNGSPVPVGRKPRRAQDANFSLSIERAGFEPRRGAILAQGARGVNVWFAATRGGFQTWSRGSNPARLAYISWRSRGRAEIFVLPFLGPCLTKAASTSHLSPLTFHLSHFLV